MMGIDFSPAVHHNGDMQYRSSNGKKLDFNQIAKAVVDLATGDTPPEAPPAPADDGKNPHAVALGRMGGLKGGKARAEKLTRKQRVAIAKKAAAARWRKR
jgi:hypothetical protein